MNEEQQAPITPQLSVVIVNWNTYEELRSCLKSLLPEHLRVTKEIIVIDNASSDGSAERIPPEFPAVHLIANSENKGYAEGCNQGILLSKAAHILLLNPDTIVNEEALERMLRFLVDHPKAGVVSCKLLLENGAAQRSWYAFPNPMNYFLYHSIISVAFQSADAWLQRMRGQTSTRAEPRSVDWLMGCCLMMRRAAIEEVGLFDPEYFMYSEDTDWCRRARRRGWSVYFLAGVEIVHLHKRSSAKRRHFTFVRLFRSLKRYYKKHHSPESLTGLKYAITVDMVMRMFVLAVMRIMQPSCADEIEDKLSAVREILKLYWHGEERREDRN